VYGWIQVYHIVLCFAGLDVSADALDQGCLAGASHACIQHVFEKFKIPQSNYHGHPTSRSHQ
jgi:hypothetical protein